jgi:DNA-binding CsgD family transcriptional regulator
LIPSPPAPIPEALADGEAALQIARDIGWRSVEVYLLLAVGRLHSLGGDFGRGLAHMQEALAVADEIGHDAWATWVYQGLGWQHLTWLMPAAAREYLARGQARAQETGVMSLVRAVAAWLAMAHVRLNDVARAEAALGLAPDFAELQRAWEGAGLPGDVLAERLMPMTMRVCFYVYAELALAQGDAARALAATDDLFACTPNVAIYGEASVSYVALARAEALSRLGRLAEAGQLLEETLAVTEQRYARALLWRVHLALGRCYRAQGQRARANAQFAAARGLVDDLALTIPEGASRAAFLREAGALVPQARPPSRRAAERQQFGGLTAREREVAVRVAQGLSNRQIARSLVLSERTIEGHVTNILTKLGLASRTQIAAWARERGLLPADGSGTL